VPPCIGASEAGHGESGKDMKRDAWGLVITGSMGFGRTPAG
jgi:hypothetical protein